MVVAVEEAYIAYVLSWRLILPVFRRGGFLDGEMSVCCLCFVLCDGCVGYLPWVLLLIELLSRCHFCACYFF
jgi:hypothetical protein